MTTLRTFQDEIENIHARETAKQRAQANVGAVASTSLTASSSVPRSPEQHRKDHADKENQKPSGHADGPAIDGRTKPPKHDDDNDPEEDRQLQVRIRSSCITVTFFY